VFTCVQFDPRFYTSLPFGSGIETICSKFLTASFTLSGIACVYVPSVRFGKACRSIAWTSFIVPHFCINVAKVLRSTWYVTNGIPRLSDIGRRFSSSQSRLLAGRKQSENMNACGSGLLQFL